MSSNLSVPPEAADAPGTPPEESLVFLPEAEAGGTDRDVLMGYQMFLGRDPETSFVIANARTSPVGAFIRGLITSGEFQSSVLDRLESGQPLRHEAGSSGPSQAQLDWLFTYIRLPARAELALRGRQDWQDWLRMFTSVPGVPKPPQRGPAKTQAAKPDIEARAAQDGFILITIETPKPAETLPVTSQINGSGWIIAPSDVVEVSVLLDEKLLTHARYGLPRPDVARSFPHYRHVDHCGFAFMAEIPQGIRLHAESRLTVTVRTQDGQTGQRAIRLLSLQDRSAERKQKRNDAAWPIRLTIEEALVGEDRTLRIRGWAVAAEPLGDITISLGGEKLGVAEKGLARPDIAKAHPSYAGADHAGFSFVWPLAESVQAGPSFIRAQATTESGQARQAIVPISIPAPVDFTAGLEAASQDVSTIKCACDLATLSATGQLVVEGWALSAEGMASIEIEMDGIAIGEAKLGQKRDDVGRHFKDNPAAATAGFTFHHTLPRPPSSGVHTLTLRLLAADGSRRLVEHPVVTEAESFPTAEPMVPTTARPRIPATIRLEIDRPIVKNGHAAEPVRGALTISGWSVAKSGIHDVTIYAGEQLLGRAYLGMRREDIASAFPDYQGALLSGWALVLPPGALEPGQHSIRVVARAHGTNAEQHEKNFTMEVATDGQFPAEANLRKSLPPAELAFYQGLLTRKAANPRYLIIISLGASQDLQGLATTLDSLRRQAYTHWHAQLVLPPQPSLRGEAADLLVQFGVSDRISIKPLAPAPNPKTRAKTRHPAPAAAALPLESADFVLRLRSGDHLGCDALLAFAVEIAAAKDADFFYADDVRLDTALNRTAACLKPDWSPELLHGTNYVGRAWCAQKSLLVAAGLDQDLHQVSDYEAALRLSEHAANIRHVTRIIGDFSAYSDTPPQQLAALQAALQRCDIAGQVEPANAKNVWRLRRLLPPVTPPRAGARAPRGPQPGLISVIIPTNGTNGLVRNVIKGLRATTAPGKRGGRDIEIIILDNMPAGEKNLRSWIKRNADSVIEIKESFNWSRFNNIGARAARGEYLLFLNDDIEMPQPDWLEAMLEHAQRPEVGVVGARLLYPDGKVQHAGQYLAESHARHAFRFADATSPGPFGLACAAREVISVTGACQMVRAQIFHDLGGFDEAHTVVNNDLDFCLRSWRAGLAVIYTPHATLTHLELASRAAMEDSFDEARFEGAWRSRFLTGDPFRNRLLANESDHYGVEQEPLIELFAGRRLPEPQNIKRILAVKLDHIGDFLTSLPAIRSLRTHYPEAQIDLLAPAASTTLARAVPELTEIIQFDFFHARSGDGQKNVGADELEALRTRLAPNNYVLAIDLRMQPETRMVLPYTNATYLAGYDVDNRFAFLDVALEWEGDSRLIAKRAHISERLVQLVVACAAAGATDHPPPPQTALKPDSVPALARLPKIFRTRPLVCIHPGVGNVVRQWPASHYAELIDMLVAEASVHVVLIGSGEEAPVAEEILRKVKAYGAVETLIGRVKLSELPDVMRACILFVGNNSGPQHLAASLGLPSIGIHSGVVDAAEWAPLGPQAMAIRRRMVCSPCYVEFAADCPRNLACLVGLRPRDVFAACQNLLP